MGKLGYPGKSHWLLVLIYNAFGRSESSRRGSRLRNSPVNLEALRATMKTNKWASDGIWLGVYYCGNLWHVMQHVQHVDSVLFPCLVMHLSCCPGLGISWVCAIPGQPSWNILKQLVCHRWSCNSGLVHMFLICWMLLIWSQEKWQQNPTVDFLLLATCKACNPGNSVALRCPTWVQASPPLAWHVICLDMPSAV